MLKYFVTTRSLSSISSSPAPWLRVVLLGFRRYYPPLPLWPPRFVSAICCSVSTLMSFTVSRGSFLTFSMPASSSFGSNAMISVFVPSHPALCAFLLPFGLVSSSIFLCFQNVLYPHVANATLLVSGVLLV